MTYQQIDTSLKYHLSLSRVSATYDAITPHLAHILLIVLYVSRPTGTCTARAIDNYLRSIKKGKVACQILWMLQDLIAAGYVSREMKGARFYYSVTLAGNCLLNDLEKTMRRTRLKR